MNLNMESQKNNNCKCNELPKFAHDLNQSLVVIQAYIKGCTERMKTNSLNYEQMSSVFLKINEQIELMGSQILELAQ